MNIILAGISHKTAKLETRERFSMRSKLVKDFLLRSINESGLKGGVVLSTCNRMELYAETDDESGAGLIRALSGYFSISSREIEDHFYQKRGTDAIEHLFSVASGMDSQVLGETQVASQVRSAWERSREFGVSSGCIDGIFRKAIAAARRVHAETALSRGNVSVCSVALRKCGECFGSLEGRSVLIVGSGKIARLMAKYIADTAMRAVFVANRTYGRAVALAGECSGEAIHFDKLFEKIKTVDIVITSTSAPHLLIKSGLIRAVKEERLKRLVMIDLGVPRDIDPAVRSIEGVSLFDMDDLKSVVEESYSLRQKEIPKAKRIIQKFVDGAAERSDEEAAV